MCRPKDATASTPTLSIDWDAYLPLFEDEDIPEEQKRALIETLWSIMVAFVDLGFGIHPLNAACGKSDEELAQAIASVVSSDHPTETPSQRAASPSGQAAGEESA